MPILTPNFLREVHNGNSDGSLLPTSPIINRLMYNLLRARYTEEGCRNAVVRPVIPVEYLGEVGKSQAVRRDPLFRLVWVPQSNDRVSARLRAMLAEQANPI